MTQKHEHKKQTAIHRYPFPREWPGFHTGEHFENAPPISFAIQGFLQNDGATLIGGLAGHGKTLMMLSIVKALLSGSGTKLWGYFDVQETASRVLYLIPEATISPFKHRLQLFDLYDHARTGRLLVRTLSFDPTTSLADPKIVDAARGAHVFLDSAIRFVEGKESDATDNQRGLAKGIFNLLGVGARTIVGAHHSPKASGGAGIMTLENVLRGSGDIGAMASTVYGVKQLDAHQNVVHIESVKSRDFEPCGPFQLIGRPYINQEHDFRMHKKPGECMSLQGEQSKGGASSQMRQQREKNIAVLRRLIQDDPKANAKDLAKRLEKENRVKLAEGTIRRYRAEIQKADA